MKKLGLFEVKTHLSELLKEVSNGDIITITKRGKPIAQLVPYHEDNKDLSVNDVLDRFKEIRNKVKGKIDIRKYVREGRKY
jgi:prevent-host-death family protein